MRHVVNNKNVLKKFLAKAVKTINNEVRIFQFLKLNSWYLIDLLGLFFSIF